MKPTSLLLSGKSPRLLLAASVLFLLLTAHFLWFQSNTAQAQGRIIYVNAKAGTGGDGSSWPDAYTSLQDALAEAGDGDEIWIAAGVYYPDEGIGQINDNRDSTFNIPPGVALYGGFAGGEVKLEDRNWDTRPTVLSGDIDGDDTVDGRGVVIDSDDINCCNAFHVVTLNGTGTSINASTRLDGVIITAGQANGLDVSNQRGGGLYCNGRNSGSKCNPTLANVTFSGNRAIGSGGAMANDGRNGGQSSPTLTNVTFSGNYAFQSDGGAMLNDGSDGGQSSPTLTSVTFAGNRAGVGGGAILNYGFKGVSSPTLTNVTFAGNWADFGGAMFNKSSFDGKSNPTLTNVIFAGNRAIESGGAMFNDGHNGGQSNPTLTNSIFTGNQADWRGGAMVNRDSSPKMTNVTFSGNRAGDNGGAMLNDVGSPRLTNVILWGNSAGNAGDVMYNFDASPTIAYSLVQGGWNGPGIGGAGATDGDGNIDGDPLFMTPVNPADAPTTAGDLRLRHDSPAIDAGDNDALPPGLDTDLDGNPRIMRAVVDMGAYEFIARLYVDAEASPGGNGSIWEDALTSLQDALSLANEGTEIWVAEGIYTPGSDVEDSFNIPSGVSLYGGFAGTEAKLEERDWDAHPTVLSGDINGNDTVDGRGVVIDPDDINGGNAFHVVTLDGTGTPITASTRIDGVIITAGRTASGFSDDNTRGGGLYCNGRNSGSKCNPTLANVTFSGNYASDLGGAMYNDARDGGASSPTLTNVTFTGNQAHSGGAMYNNGRDGGASSPTLTNVTFSGNRANDSGGAMYNTGHNGGESSPTLTNVTFSGNSVVFSGGAMISDGGSPTLTNVIFAGNRAHSGGAMFYANGSPTLTNVTFSGNQAGNAGGAMYNFGSNGETSPTLTNVIFWNNSAGHVGDVMYNNGAGAMTTIAYSLVQGGLGEDGGIANNNGGSVIDDGNNIDADPLFMMPINPEDAPTTTGDLRLRPGSPAIDVGDNDALPAGLTTDLDGNPRQHDATGKGTPIVDMGAYELQLQCEKVTSRLYVNSAADGADNGDSWVNAFTSLRDALDTAAFCGNVDEIWLAKGIYTPGYSRGDSFHIPPGVAVYGGFAGGEDGLEGRNWEDHPTVLSGDIGRDDGTDERGVVTDTSKIVNENAYHVVWLDGTTTPITASTRIDGVIITAGQADGGAFPDNAGGGLYCNGYGAGSVCSPTLTNVTFASNLALFGGAMINDGDQGTSSPTLTNVAFSGNQASLRGGAMYNVGFNGGQSSPTLTNVTFSGNSAGHRGGAMYNDGVDGVSSPTLTNVTFAGNWAEDRGGAMYNAGAEGQSSPTLTNVTFSGNSVTNLGGAMYNNGTNSGQSSPTLTNVTFRGNAATYGGAMYNNGASSGQSSPKLTNVTFAGNRAENNGGAMLNYGDGGASTPTLTNAIFWGNSAGNAGDVMDNYGAGARPTIAYSLVQGHSDDSSIVNSNGGSVAYGDGNIDGDPLFVTPVNPDDAPTTDGDLRLRPGSPAIDAGDNDALPAGVDTDLDGNLRMQGGTVDMGAYEYIPALLAVEMTPSSVPEDSGQALTITFTRTQNTVGELVVAFDVGGTATFGDDYVQSGASSFDGSSGAVTLSDGVISHTLLLTPTADFIAEPDETITLSLTPSASYELGAAATVTGTILNDDTAGVLVSPTTGLITTEAGGTASFTVTLQSEPTGAVTIALTSSDPGEGTVSPKLLTFNATNWQTAQTVTITGVDDDVYDGDQPYTITLIVSSDDPVYDGLTAPTVTITNLDDDDPPPAEYRTYLPLVFSPPPSPGTVEAHPARSPVP